MTIIHIACQPQSEDEVSHALGSLRTIVECEELLERSSEDLAAMSPAVSRAMEASRGSMVTQLPEGIHGHLIQTLGLDGYRLEWSARLSEAEGSWLLSQFMPDRADSPDWEEGSFENAVSF
jgi:hypothetical protein